MPSCEKCWSDSGGDQDRYRDLVSKRNCTPEQQAGDGADLCPFCKRATVHIHTEQCLVCKREF
jgi:hypothetical protein